MVIQAAATAITAAGSASRPSLPTSSEPSSSEENTRRVPAVIPHPAHRTARSATRRTTPRQHCTRSENPKPPQPQPGTPSILRARSPSQGPDRLSSPQGETRTGPRRAPPGSPPPGVGRERERPHSEAAGHQEQPDTVSRSSSARSRPDTTRNIVSASATPPREPPGGLPRGASYPEVRDPQSGSLEAGPVAQSDEIRYPCGPTSPAGAPGSRRHRGPPLPQQQHPGHERSTEERRHRRERACGAYQLCLTGLSRTTSVTATPTRTRARSTRLRTQDGAEGKGAEGRQAMPGTCDSAVAPPPPIPSR